MNADQLIYNYTKLPKKQQREFDRRYASLQQFNANMKVIMDFIKKGKQHARRQASR